MTNVLSSCRVCATSVEKCDATAFPCCAPCSSTWPSTHAVEVAPRWALCSDCRLSNLSTCPQVPQCWAPLRTEDLPAEQPE